MGVASMVSKFVVGKIYYMSSLMVIVFMNVLLTLYFTYILENHLEKFFIS